VILRRVKMSNNVDTTESYWNGDGFAAEEDTYGLVLEDTLAVGNTDAGYDMKSRDLTLSRTSAVGNKRNSRLWGAGVQVRDAIASDPLLAGGSGSQAQFWIGPRAVVSMTGASATSCSSRTVVYDLERGARLDAANVDVTMSSGATLVRGGKAASIIRADERIRLC
jgi:hypothetical protein